jgi:hypothetical protein
MDLRRNYLSCTSSLPDSSAEASALVSADIVGVVYVRDYALWLVGTGLEAASLCSKIRVSSGEELAFARADHVFIFQEVEKWEQKTTNRDASLYSTNAHTRWSNIQQPVREGTRGCC